jgi:hypothetical protein
MLSRTGQFIGLCGQVGSADLLRPNRPEVLVEPAEDVADQLVESGDMSALVDREPLAIRGSAEQREEGLRGRLERKDEVISSVQHRRGRRDVRREIQRIHFGRTPSPCQPAGQKHHGLESPLNGNDWQRRLGTGAGAVVAQLRRVDIGASAQVVDRPTQIFRPLDGHVAVRVYLLDGRIVRRPSESLEHSLVDRKDERAAGAWQKVEMGRHAQITGGQEGAEDMAARKPDDRLVRRGGILGQEDVDGHALVPVRRGDRNLLGPIMFRVLGLLHAWLERPLIVRVERLVCRVEFVGDRLVGSPGRSAGRDRFQHRRRQGRSIPHAAEPDDRSRSSPDGTFTKLRFSTPLHEYRDFGPLHLAGYGEARWRLPDGEFTYGEFTMEDVVTNVR